MIVPFPLEKLLFFVRKVFLLLIWGLGKVKLSGLHMFRFTAMCSSAKAIRRGPSEKNQCSKTELGQKTKSEFSNALSVEKIFKAKKSALRHGIWFSALNRVERGVVDLTVRYVDSIKSTKLATVLTAIMQKLTVAAESIVDKMAKSVGFVQARKISEIALK
ncbi:MAG: hypothetical protein NWF05_08050, partial [Candidatus Bathyarchaeota archaeon]|nr:hypothetical protein [Candidatus Bathyarchaeota archaeon]